MCVQEEQIRAFILTECARQPNEYSDQLACRCSRNDFHKMEHGYRPCNHGDRSLWGSCRSYCCYRSEGVFSPLMLPLYFCPLFMCSLYIRHLPLFHIQYSQGVQLLCWKCLLEEDPAGWLTLWIYSGTCLREYWLILQMYFSLVFLIVSMNRTGVAIHYQ